MRIHIKTTDLELTKPLAEYIKKKIGGLGRFIKKFDKQLQKEVSAKQIIIASSRRQLFMKSAISIAEYYFEVSFRT